jgi:hypothetical protein
VDIFGKRRKLMENKLLTKLSTIQKGLVAPKGQFNSFGKYKYRSCEDILEALKPLLGDSVLTVSDEVVMIGTRFYVKATATLTDGSGVASVSAYAREEEVKKGMDGAQVTGAASSYARKYALNGLFCIDDSKDADSTQGQTKEDVFISDQELSRLMDMILETESDQVKFCQYLKVESLEKLPKDKYQQAMIALQNKKKVAK